MVHSCLFVIKVSNEPAAMLRVCVTFVFAALNAGPTLVFAEPSPTPGHIVSRIPREPVESTAIAKIDYSKRRHILEIEFVNGAAYRYLDVPATVHRDLMA